MLVLKFLCFVILNNVDSNPFQTFSFVKGEVYSKPSLHFKNGRCAGGFNNNNEVYCLNNKSYTQQAKFDGDTMTFEICFNVSTCFCLSLFRILCMDGIADCMVYIQH